MLLRVPRDKRVRNDGFTDEFKCLELSSDGKNMFPKMT